MKSNMVYTTNRGERTLHQEEINHQSHRLEEYFNSNEWKQEQEKIQNESVDFLFSNNDNDSLKRIQKLKMEELSKTLDNYFSSENWKQQQEEMEAQPVHQQTIGSAANRQEEINQQAQKLNDYFNSNEWTQQQEETLSATPAENTEIEETKYHYDWRVFKGKVEYKEQRAMESRLLRSIEKEKRREKEKTIEIMQQANKVNDYFKSYRWAHQQQEMQEALADNEHFYFNNEEWRQQEQIKELEEKLKDLITRPQKEHQEALAKATSSLSAYFDSPEWKEEQQKAMSATIAPATVEAQTAEYSQELVS